MTHGMSASRSNMFEKRHAFGQIAAASKEGGKRLGRHDEYQIRWG